MGTGPLCSVPDVEERLGADFAPGSAEYSRAERACAYVSAVLRARFPLIPDPVPPAVAVVATEVAVRYMAADPATGGVVSEQIGGYSYRRASGMGSTRLTDDEYLVLQPYGSGMLRTIALGRGTGSSCRCGYGPDEECFAVVHAMSAPLSEREPLR